MKKILILITTLFLFHTGYSQTSENTQTISDGTSIEYVDLDNDIMSSSNLSFGFLGGLSLLSYNLVYEWGKDSIKNGIFLSNTPFFKYTKIGYAHDKIKTIKDVVRNTSYGITISGSKYNSGLAISPYFTQIYNFENNIKLGYTFLIRDNTHGDFYLLDELYRAAVYTKYSLMLIGIKELKYDKFIIAPEVFLLSSIRTHYFNIEEFEGSLDIWYWEKFNASMYYGTSIKYKFTKNFYFGTKFRSCYNYNPSDKKIGYKKSTPYILSIGCNYNF